MTGQELIDWIRENHAEEMKVVVLYREKPGGYPVDEDLEPETGLLFLEQVVVL